MDQSLYNFGEKMIIDDMIIADNIYVDIEFLKYIKLGALFAHKDLTQDTYTTMVNMIIDHKFSVRYTDDPEKLFENVPGMKELIGTPNDVSDDVIFALSPSFKEPIQFIRNCIAASDMSKRLVKNKNETTIVIDVSSLPGLTDNVCQRIVNEYSVSFDMDVKLIRTDPKLLPNQLMNFDIYYVSDMGRFNSVMIEHLNAQQLIGKYLFCTKLLPMSKLPDLKEHAIEQTFYSIELVMTAAAKFRYVDPFNCLT